MKSEKMLGIFFVLSFVIFNVFMLSADTGEPEYSGESGHIFWFMQVSDTHISNGGGPYRDNFIKATGECVDIIDPAFFLNSGDVTDGSQGLSFVCAGPQDDEWNEYHEILNMNSMEYGFYFDVAGNHDVYNDFGLFNWVSKSVVGQATGHWMGTWSVNFSYGKYLFQDLGTASNVGLPWAQDSAMKGYIIQEEVDKVNEVLNTHSDSDIIFAFGHHDPENTEGFNLMRPVLDSYGVKYYTYGHIHDVGFKNISGLASWRVNTLGHYTSGEAPGSLAVFAIDNNSVSFTGVDIADPWPLIVVTAPVPSAYENGESGMVAMPYAPSVPACENAPVRALVFKNSAVSSVKFRFDGGEWVDMTKSSYNDVLWLGWFDASTYSAGEKQLEVGADGRIRSIKVNFSGETCNIDPGRGDVEIEKPAVVTGDDEAPDFEEPDSSEIVPDESEKPDENSIDEDSGSFTDEENSDNEKNDNDYDFDSITDDSGNEQEQEAQEPGFIEEDTGCVLLII